MRRTGTADLPAELLALWASQLVMSILQTGSRREGEQVTPKERVLKKYPKARAYQWSGPFGWVIYAQDGYGLPQTLNVADETAVKAWAEAARRLKKRRGQ